MPEPAQPRGGWRRRSPGTKKEPFGKSAQGEHAEPRQPDACDSAQVKSGNVENPRPVAGLRRSEIGMRQDKSAENEEHGHGVRAVKHHVYDRKPAPHRQVMRPGKRADRMHQQHG